MSDCPFYIKPEFIDRLSVRIYESQPITNYFRRGVINIITGFHRDPDTSHSCIMNIMAGTNKQNQIIPCISDLLYLQDVDDSESALVSLEYGLRCLQGPFLEKSITINMFTWHRPTFWKCLNMFEYVRRYQDDHFALDKYVSSLDDSTLLTVFDLLRELKLDINLIYIRRAAENLNQTLQIFNYVNTTKTPATLYDIGILESFVSEIYQACSGFNKNRLAEINYYK